MTAPRTRLTIASLVLAALVVRALAFSPYALHHPDEAIQYLEQAHRLAFGPGIVPWEYRAGMRSWLVPLLLAGPMWLGDRIAPGSELYVILPRAAAAVVALAPLWAAWRLGGSVSERHGLAALAVAALWYESVYFSVHVLTETLSVALFLPAAALLLTGERTRRRLAAAGALLGFAVVFRFHYGPAAAVLAALALGWRWREWGWLAAGGAAALLGSGVVDLAMGQAPFGWVVENIRLNVIEDRAAEFGVAGAGAYAQMLWLAWSAALVPILWLAIPGARRFPPLAAAAAVTLAVHLAIGHKEYRFILLATQIVLLLAAIGTAERARARWLWPALAAWAAVSAWLAFAPGSEPGWRRHAPGYQLVRAAAVRRACGVAIFGGDYWPALGQTWLHGATPTYYLRGPDPAVEWRSAVRIAPAFDAAIAPPGRASVPAGYRPVACAGTGGERLCLAMRAGGCVRSAASVHQEVQRVMERNRR